MNNLLYKGIIICFVVAIMGCNTMSPGGITEEVDIYDDVPGYAPGAIPEGPELFDLPETFEPGMNDFYNEPFDEL